MDQAVRVDGTGSQDQTRVVAFLADPASHGCARVDRIDTHAASVFMAGDRAYKLKRAVRFPFLDFSTLERRRTFSLAEVALNRRTAPEIYLGVAAVAEAAGGALRLVEPAPPIGPGILDYVVVMRRFRQEDLLDRMAERGELTPAMARDLAEMVAAFHEEAEPRPDGAGAAEVTRLAALNTGQMRRYADVFPADRVDRLDALSRQAAARLGPLIERRRQAGYVRHCHGDLHLRNLVLLDGKVIPFDCIEFDEGLAVTDVLYDLAFLLMDLEFRRLRPLGNVVLNRYLELTGDLAGLALLPLFMSIRAGIRAHLSAAAGLAAEGGQAGSRRAEAVAYLDLALSLLSPPPPRLVAIGGLSGSGKTTLARHLAPEIGPAPGAVILRSDVLRKRMAGVGEEERLPPDAYAEPMTARVYGEMAGHAGLALDSRHAVICDGVYARPCQRDAIQAIAQAAGAAFTGLWLVADRDTQVARVNDRTGDASDATADVVRRQAAYDLGVMRWDVIPANGPPGDVAAIARRLVGASGG